MKSGTTAHNKHQQDESTDFKHTTTPSSPLSVLKQTAVPLSCNTLLLGDSLLQGIDERKMSVDGNTVKNISVPGLTVNHLCQWLTSRRPSSHIRHVVFQVGINSCREGPVSPVQWAKLINLIRQAFPSATLQASSLIPPPGQHPLKEAASRSTANLRRTCLQERIVYTDNTPTFLAKSGAPKKAMYKDDHPSALGYKYLALNIRYHDNHRHAQRTSMPHPHNSPRLQRDHTNSSSSPHPHTRQPSPAIASSTSDSPMARTAAMYPMHDYNTDFPSTAPKHPDSPGVFNVLGRHQPVGKQPLISQPPHPQPFSCPPRRNIDAPHVNKCSDGSPTMFPLHTTPPPVFPPPAVTQHPPHKTEGHLHPYAVQFLNAMAAHFMSQQQQMIPCPTY